MQTAERERRRVRQDALSLRAARAVVRGPSVMARSPDVAMDGHELANRAVLVRDSFGRAAVAWAGDGGVGSETTWSMTALAEEYVEGDATAYAERRR